MPNDNNLGNDDTNISAPRIRTFQMDSDSIGNVKKSVNLFRGDVNIPLNLISLPGRNGLDANVTAFYESNVQNSVSTWNLEAPTGILGMGWSLPHDRVVFANPSNGSEYGEEYYLITGGSGELLVKVSSDEEETDDRTGKHIFTEYKTENYQFWKILHHRYLYNDKNEKDKDYWEIIKENGITYVYGGDFSVGEDGNKISAGNSIQWGVEWKNWFGTSSLDDGEQEQFALGWNIYQIRNCWDDIITFEYENTEQQVGRGLKYTKASYLEKITDSYGRTAVFYYGDKIYSEDKQEYQDPHKDLQPSGDCSEHVNLDTPNAYQDRYETKYLDVIRVNNEDNELLFSIHFDYGPDLKNIVDPSEPGLWKRYLLSITYQNVDSESLPGMKFEYYLDEADAHPGALKSITYPEGGKVEYTYKRSLLPNSRRDFEIQDMKNGEIPLSGKVPRVWFGEDYVVVALYDDSAGELHVSVYSWAGWWVEHYCGQSNCTKQGFASLQVTTEKDLFVIYYKGATEIISYRKNSYKYGSWDYYPAEITRQSTDSEDIRPILISGSNFVIVYDAGLSGNALQGYYWRNGEQAGWHSLSGFLPYADSSSQVALAGKNNYYIVYSSSDQYKINFCYLDEQGTPHQGPQWNSDFHIFKPPDKVKDFYLWWTLGDTFVIATYITKIDDRKITYEVRIFQWDEEFEIGDKNPDVLEYDVPLKAEIPIIASIFQNSLVASGPYLLRYTGGSYNGWNPQVLEATENAAHYQFAYDSDTAIMSDSSNNDTQFAEFHPTGGWSTDSPLPASGDGKPTIRSNYLTLDDAIYYRNPSGEWKKLGPSLSDEGEINPQSVQNMAPAYVVCEKSDGKATYIAILENGDLKSIETLSDQKFYIDKKDVQSAPSGTMLATADTFITWTGDSFDKADTLFLNRVVSKSAKGEISDYRVHNLRIDDKYLPQPLGTGMHNTYFEYDDETATFNPSGNVSQYSKVIVIPGGTEDADNIVKPFGWTEQYFYNALDPLHPGMLQPYDPCTNARDYYSLLNGFLLHSNTYDSENNIVSSATNYWRIFPFPKELNDIKEGAYIRQKKQIAISEQALIFTDNSKCFPGYLEEQDMSNVRKIFEHNKFPISDNSYISIAVEFDWWMIVDPGNQTAYIVKQVKEQDSESCRVYCGLYMTSETDYNEYGQVEKTTTRNYNSTGQMETIVKCLKYGWQVYPEMLSHNLLVPVVQQTSQNNDTVTAVSATTWKDWGCGRWAPHKTYIARTIEAAEKGFDFSGVGEPSELDWLKQSDICSRTPKGLVKQLLDANNIYKSVIYDDDQRFPVAVFNNSTVEEASFWGFEDYESDQGWKINPGDEIVKTGEAHTGSNSLKILGHPDKKKGLQNNFQFQVSSQNKKHILSCWIRTEDGFAEDQGNAYWEISLNGEILGEPIPIDDTAAKWKYLYIPIDISMLEENATASIRLLLYSQKRSKYLLVDDIRFSPFVCDFRAYIYDSSKSLVTAKLGTNGETMRYVYNNFSRAIATVGPDENVNTLNSQYYSRKGNNDCFAPSDPNSRLGIRARSGGIYSNFNTGSSEWQNSWKPDAAQDWKVRDNLLMHTKTSSGIITLNDSDEYRDFGLYFKVSSDVGTSLDIDHPLGVKIGDMAIIQWTPSVGWELYDGSACIKPAKQPTTVAREWLLLAVENGLLFYADGQQIFAYNEFDATISGLLSLFTGDRISFKDIIILRDPIVVANYVDGAGRKHQTQLLEGRNCLAKERIYDELGRMAVITKSVRHENTLLGYQDSLIRTLDRETGEMTGYVADYYPDDENYPYSRQIFETSPLSRVIEKGNPGKDFAITPADEQHTVKVSYGINVKEDWVADLGLPDRQYAMRETVDQNGVESLVLTDRLGRKIAERKGPILPEGNEHQISQYEYDEAGNRVKVKLPNKFSSGAGNDGWENSFEYDFSGQMVQKKNIDAGVSKYIYDKVGRLRFMQDAEGASKDYVLYTTYDFLGRPIEKGVLLNCAWDKIAQEDADNDLYLPSGVMRVLSKEYSYDENDYIKKNLPQYRGTPYSIGRLSSVLTYPNDEDNPIEEYFTYDIYGNVICKSIKVTNYDAGMYHTFYEYSNLGNVTKITYPFATSERETFEVFYGYNHLGKLSGIGKTKDNPVDYATYTYNAEGSVYTESLNNGNPDAIAKRVHTYNSPGWIKTIDDDLFGESVKYTSGGYSEECPGYHNGDIARIDFAFKWDDSPDDYAFQYQYDNLGRLQVAKNSLNDQWSDGVGKNNETAYDENGNMLRLHRGNTDKKYSFRKNNRVINTDGSEKENYTYDGNGNIIHSPAKTMNGILYGPLTLFYDKFNYMTRATKIEDTGKTLYFEYDGKNRRLLKQLRDDDVITSSKLYLHGLSSLPLIEKSDEKVTLYIYGPGGLVAMQQDNAICYVLKDHEGSIRVVFDESRNVKAAFDYMPFGNLMRASNEGFTSYLYTGQEFDAETRLYNYRARMYESDLGRFYAIDPEGQFPSPYIYAGEDPVLFTDPTGMFSWGWFSLAAMGVISLAEIGGGIALDVVSVSTAAEIGGGTLMGAGLEGLGYDIEQAVAGFKGGDLHTTGQLWAGFGVAEVVGAIVGTAAAGVGAVGSAVVSAIAEVGVSAAGGLASTSAGNVTRRYIFEDRSRKLTEGLGRAAILGAVSGGLGYGAGRLTRAGTGRLFSRLGRRTARSLMRGGGIVSGGVLGGGMEIAENMLESGKIDWEEFGIDTALGAIGGVVGAEEGMSEKRPADEMVVEMVGDVAIITTAAGA